MAKQNWRAQGEAPRRRAKRWETSSRGSEAEKAFRLSPTVMVSLLLLLLLIVLLVSLIRFLDPVNPARLLVITAVNSSRNLPVHASAATDARVLSFQSVLDTDQATTSPLDRAEFLASISGIETHQPRKLALLPWRPATSVVYVNATGVALPEGDADSLSAWLVPSDFNPQRDVRKQLIRFQDLVSATADSGAERKLLVLDCQVAEANRLFAETADRFVEVAAQELSQLSSEQQEGLFVLFSCSPGEFTWPWPSRTESIFGHFFSTGISGEADAAGDTNERVDLKELHDYLKKNVSHQSLLLCDAQQTPMLVDFGQPSGKITLVSTTEGRGFQRPVAPTQSTTRSDVVLAMERNWKRYCELTQRTPPPQELTPAAWTRVQDGLLLAESQIRGNELDMADATIRDVENEIETLVDVHRTFHRLTEPSSMTMLGVPDAFETSAWPEFAAVDESDDDILRDLVDERISPAEARERIDELAATQSDPLDSDQQLFRLMMASRVGQEPITIGERERQLLRNRRLAEIVSIPGYPCAAPWIHNGLRQADQARRLLEDRYLLSRAAPVLLGPDSAVPAEDVAALYDKVRRTDQTLSRAFRLRDRLLSELPYWIQFLRVSARHADAGDPPEAVEPEENQSASDDNQIPEEPTAARTDMVVLASELVPVLVTETARVSALLMYDPQGSAAARNDDTESRIQQAATAAALVRERLMRRLREYAADLNDDRLWPPTGRRWRRIDNLLNLPFACLLPDAPAEEVAHESARLRVSLLRKTLIAAGESTRLSAAPDRAAADGADADKPVAEADQLRRVSALSGQLVTIPLTAVSVPSAEAKPAEWYTWFEERHRELRETTIQTDALTWSDSIRADVAFRLSPANGFRSPVLSPTMSHYSRVIARHLLFQAARAVEDFYASRQGDPAHYYAAAAAEFRDAAVKVLNSSHFVDRIREAVDADENAAEVRPSASPGGMISEQLRLLDEQLAQYGNALESATLQSEPPELLYRAASSADLRLSLSGHQAFPVGLAGIRVSPASRVQRTASVDGNAFAEFEVTRPADSAEVKPGLEALAWFRGHVFRVLVNDVVIDELDGPSFVYQQQNVGNGKLFLQARRLSEEPLQLMFVLDCSKSMSFEDELGSPRIRSLSRILRRFADFAQAGSIEAGIRLFGHRVASIEDPAARTDTERVLQVAPFAPARLQRLLPLVPTGHSPIFHALLSARTDFPESETEVRREIILISDGADNWAQAGEQPGIRELREAFSGSAIRINTIGYNVSKFADSEQLREIAQETGGRAVTVTDAEGLFRELVGLAGLPGYRVLENDRVIAEGDRLDVSAGPIELPPGHYAVEIRGGGNDVITRQVIHVLPGEEHRLEYDSGALRYAANPKRDAVAVVGGETGQPDLVVLSVRRSDAGVELEFGLLPDETTRDFLLPVAVSISTPETADQLWRIQSLPPNQNSRHFPAWNVRIEDWPDDAQRIALEVRWNQSIRDSVPVPLDWDSPHREIEVAPGVRLVKQTRRLAEDGDGPAQVTLTFAFDDSGPEVQEWTVVPQAAIASVRHVCRPDVGLYSVQLSLSDGTLPDVVDLIRLHRDPTDPVLSADVSLGNERINR